MKIGALSWIAFGIAFSVIALSYAFFQHWRPNVAETASYVEYRDQLIREAAKKDQAIAKVEDARKQVAAKIVEWQQIVAAKTPPASLKEGGIDLSVNGFQLVLDAPKFRNSVQKAVNDQMKAGGVTVVQGPNVPMPPLESQAILANYFNYPALPFPVCVFDLGQVTVEGTFEQISENMRAWSRMPHYLAVADGLSLQGTSPRLTGNYSVSLVAFIRTPRPIFPQITGQVAAAPAGGAAGSRRPAVPGGSR